MPTILLAFAGCALVIVAAGVALARSADLIAARTSLGGLWMGSIFLAIATSLPELTTDISAIRMGSPDIAAGDLMGSSMANMLILALVSVVPRSALFERAALENTLTAALAIVVTTMAAVIILLRPSDTLLGIGFGSLTVLVVYLVGTRAIYHHSTIVRELGEVAEMSPPPGDVPPAEPHGKGLLRPILVFAAGAVVILVVAPLFASLAKELADRSGLGESFVGTLLVGLSTSLPELVTSLTAVRLHAYDLAVANLFGSNAVNMTMIAVLDLAHPGAPLLSAVEPVHAISALFAVILMAIGIAAIVSRARRKLSLLQPSGGLMLLAYLVALVALYRMRS